jgi:acetylornithine deacetylase/succinyl-diaminopimelate desuccinylase-like protein
MTPENLAKQQLADVRSLIDSNFDNRIAELISLAKIPGIAWEAFDQAKLEESAEAVSKLFSDTNVFETVDILRAQANGKDGAPAVIARRPAKNGRPQILLYAHHDVQPPGDEQEWLSEPFLPAERDGRLYGRGTADDKAGIVTHLAAVRALAEIAGNDFDLGLTVFIEGEEEAGSPTFRAFLDKYQAELEADVIIVADSGNWTVDIPALTTSLRGLVSQVIEVATLDHALHSGMYGGAVPDATMALIRLLASLHDEQGNVSVSGLKQSQAQKLPYSQGQLRQDAGMLPNTEEIGSGSILDRIWTKPAITVIGIDAQSVAVSSNTLLPRAKAKISLRIAPGEEPERALELLRKHLLEHVPFGAEISFLDVELGRSFAADSSGWASEAATKSLSEAWGTESVNIGIGGSIPFIAELTEVFPKAQILVTGVEDSDSRAHSPNESVHLEMLKKAMVAEALVLLEGNARQSK